MGITVEAVYENGVLKPSKPLPFKEHDKVTITIDAGGTRRGYGLIRWTGSVEDLDLIEESENDPLEAVLDENGPRRHLGGGLAGPFQDQQAAALLRAQHCHNEHDDQRSHGKNVTSLHRQCSCIAHLMERAPKYCICRLVV